MFENSYKNSAISCQWPNSSRSATGTLEQFEDVIRKYLREVPPGPDQHQIEFESGMLIKPIEFHRPWTIEEQARADSHKIQGTQIQQVNRNHNSASLTRTNTVPKTYAIEDELPADIPWTVLEKSVPPSLRRVYQNSSLNKYADSANKYSLVSPYHFGKRRPYQIFKRSRIESRTRLVDPGYSTPPSNSPQLSILPEQQSPRTGLGKKKGVSENITKLQNSANKYLSQLEGKFQEQDVEPKVYGPTPPPVPSHKYPITISYAHNAIPLIDITQMTLEKIHELRSLGVFSMIPLLGNEHVFHNI